MSVSSKLRWKRYVNELRFAHRELNFIREICEEGGPEFQKHYEDYCERNNINLRELNKKYSHHVEELYPRETNDGTDNNPQLDASIDSALVRHDSDSVKFVNRDREEEYPQQLGEYQMTQDEMEIHEAFNKVFRKIALVLHPDKLGENLSLDEKKEKLELFTNAKKSLENRKYFVLLETADQLCIATPRNYKQQIRWMKKELKDLNQKIKEEKNTYNYVFAECETEGEKDTVIIRFMAHVFGPQIFQQ